MTKEEVLQKFIKHLIQISPEDIKLRPEDCREAQIIEGEWYMPKWDCDTLEIIIAEFVE